MFIERLSFERIKGSFGRMSKAFEQLSNGLFFFEGCILITAMVCAYKLNNAR